jgi:hypothetical protein
MVGPELPAKYWAFPHQNFNASPFPIRGVVDVCVELEVVLEDILIRMVFER